MAIPIKIVSCSQGIYREFRNLPIFNDYSFELVELDYSKGVECDLPEDKLCYDHSDFFGKEPVTGKNVTRAILILADFSSRESATLSRGLIKRLGQLNSFNLILFPEDCEESLFSNAEEMNTCGRIAVAGGLKGFVSSASEILKGFKYLESCNEIGISDLACSVRKGICRVVGCGGEIQQMEEVIKTALGKEKTGVDTTQEYYFLIVTGGELTMDLYDETCDINNSRFDEMVIGRFGYVHEKIFGSCFKAFFFLLDENGN